MFSVLFEVRPEPDQWDAYLASAKMLRPELEQVDGFVDNIRYRSLTREGWLLSLSGWRDEKSVVRWRTAGRHHMMQERGRTELLRDYHLRVGQITCDSRVPAGQRIEEQRLDETEVGEGTTVTLIDAKLIDAKSIDAKGPEASRETTEVSAVAADLGLDAKAAGLVSWDVFDAVLTPGDVILMITWKTNETATAFASSAALPPDGRLRQVRVVRDYGMFDRREAPQYYPAVEDRRSRSARLRPIEAERSR